jgi:hypothetical protein
LIDEGEAVIVNDDEDDFILEESKGHLYIKRALYLFIQGVFVGKFVYCYYVMFFHYESKLMKSVNEYDTRADHRILIPL